MIDSPVLVIQPSENDPPQRLGAWIRSEGVEIDLRRPGIDDLPNGLEEYSALIVLGGEMGALQDNDHPWLVDLRSLISVAASTNVPFLGICLGAQLLAVATGGQVRRAKDGPEVGAGLLARRDAAATDPLFSELPLTPAVMQFRRDDIAMLPPTATLLASSPKYPNQIFRIGQSAYGLQFHIETVPETVLEWKNSFPDIADFASPEQLDENYLSDFHDEIEQTWRPIVTRFLELISHPPAMDSRRGLPLI